MAKPDQHICVIGLGYIGLPTASLLATKGFRVTGVDVSPPVVQAINAGGPHIYEPDLDVLVKSAVGSGRLKAQGEPCAADVFILAVPTPFHEGHKPDLGYVEAASRTMAQYLQPGNLVILESTSPVGATEKIAAWLAEERPDLAAGLTAGNGNADRIYVAHCPERVLPGRVLIELVENDRIVGGIDAASTRKAAAFYKSFVAGEILATDSRTAELAKLTENAYRDVNIAFANELSLICDRLGIDVWRLVEVANHHPRVNILQPGPGVGGHCIAVDPWFIVDAAPDLAKLMRTARDINDGKPGWVIDRVRAAAAMYDDPTIACLGLSYKADIDDVRESPALHITAEIAREKLGRVLVADPYVDALPPVLADQAHVTKAEAAEAIAAAQIVLLLVDHSPFKALDRKLLAGKTILDMRGLWRL